MARHDMIPPRELLLTTSVKWFLEHWGDAQESEFLNQSVLRAVSGELEKSSGSLYIAPYFLLKVFPPAKRGGPERVLVWNAREDGGALFSQITPESILSKATSAGFGLQ